MLLCVASPLSLLKNFVNNVSLRDVLAQSNMRNFFNVDCNIGSCCVTPLASIACIASVWMCVRSRFPSSRVLLSCAASALVYAPLTAVPSGTVACKRTVFGRFSTIGRDPGCES